MDSSGEQHLRLDHDIYKSRLDIDGNPIEEPKKEGSISISEFLTLDLFFNLNSAGPEALMISTPTGYLESFILTLYWN